MHKTFVITNGFYSNLKYVLEGETSDRLATLYGMFQVETNRPDDDAMMWDEGDAWKERMEKQFNIKREYEWALPDESQIFAEWLIQIRGFSRANLEVMNFDHEGG